MKKCIGIVGIFLFIGFGSLLAQPEKKSPEEHAKHAVEKMTKNLSLTPEQQQAVYQIVLDHATKMQVEAQKMQRAKEEFQKARKSLGDEMESKMESVLDEEQLANARAHRQEMKENKKREIGMRKHKLEQELNELDE